MHIVQCILLNLKLWVVLWICIDQMCILIFSTKFEILKESVSWIHPENAWDPIYSTESGIIKDPVKLEHELNACDPLNYTR